MVWLRQVHGSSMEPKLSHGDIVVFVRRRSYQPQSVVLANAGGREVVKRIDHRNAHSVYLLGDNKLASTDSRAYGYVSADEIKGSLLFVLRVGKHR